MMQPQISPSKAQEIGGPVVDFTLNATNGSQVSLTGAQQGKRGAVVIFWSGVCSHCVRYDAYLNSFAERHPNLGLVVIASRSGETPEQIRQTANERRLSFPIALDPGSRVAQAWVTEQTPRAFLVDADQKLLYRGAIDNFKYPDHPEYVGHLETAIAEYLSGNPVQRAETASFGCAIRSVYYTLPKHL